ncbi:MAG: DUF6090 family protein [Psychroserpens sp.]|uniref:DUF6090 family protein n=1 Tax=Psychroserpens sp. TaxID=2020870 RepID=UPI0030038A77
MENNKTGKYFKYAIGEIVLVVIGILIAISINNWNENRKNRISESEYYCKILSDFELDRQNIEELYKASEYKIETSKRLLLELNSKDKAKSYLLNNYLQALRTNAFVPSKVTITDIISSGKLSLLTNDSLKNNIIRYYVELDKLLYQLEINRSKSLQKAFSYDDNILFGFQNYDYVKKSLGNEILETLPVYNWQFDSESKYYKQFQNDLVFFVTMSEREKQHFSNILKEMEITYNQLKKECDSK